MKKPSKYISLCLAIGYVLAWTIGTWNYVGRVLPETKYSFGDIFGVFIAFAIAVLLGFLAGYDWKSAGQRN